MNLLHFNTRVRHCTQGNIEATAAAFTAAVPGAEIKLPALRPEEAAFSLKTSAAHAVYRFFKFKTPVYKAADLRFVIKTLANSQFSPQLSHFNTQTINLCLHAACPTRTLRLTKRLPQRSVN